MLLSRSLPKFHSRGNFPPRNCGRVPGKMIARARWPRADATFAARGKPVGAASFLSSAPGYVTAQTIKLAIACSGIQASETAILSIRGELGPAWLPTLCLRLLPQSRRLADALLTMMAMCWIIRRLYSDAWQINQFNRGSAIVKRWLVPTPDIILKISPSSLSRMALYSGHTKGRNFPG